jgi:CspA family cold shock protein
MIGPVKRLNTQKGYDFIQSEDRSKDMFIYISAVERSGIANLRESQPPNAKISTTRRRMLSALGSTPLRLQ